MSILNFIEIVWIIFFVYVFLAAICAVVCCSTSKTIRYLVIFHLWPCGDCRRRSFFSDTLLLLLRCFCLCLLVSVSGFWVIGEGSSVIWCFEDHKIHNYKKATLPCSSDFIAASRLDNAQPAQASVLPSLQQSNGMRLP